MHRYTSAIVVVGLSVVVLAACASTTRPSAAQPAGPAAVGTAGTTGPASAVTAGPGSAVSTGPASAVDPHTITTRATAMVSAVPDTLTVVLGVQTQATSAQAALAADNDNANALIATLKRRGVAAKDIQTTDLSIQPTYANESQTIIGYVVSNSVRATLHNLGAAGAVIDAAAEAAGDATRLQEVSFSVADDSAALAQARAAAVRQATEQARQMAAAAGTTLGQVRSITEITNSSPTVNFAAPAASSGAAAPTPIEPGTQQLSVTVDVSYLIP